MTAQNLSRAQRRVMDAGHRLANTFYATVRLYDANWSLTGHALRKTCDELCMMGLLDEDQSKLSEDGRGDFEYVRVAQ